MTREAIHTTVREYFEGKPVSKISIFGSYAAGEDNQNSDLDILLQMDHPVGLMELSRYKNDLEEKIKMKIDIGTEAGLSKYVADKVRENSEVIYEA